MWDNQSGNYYRSPADRLRAETSMTAVRMEGSGKIFRKQTNRTQASGMNSSI
jgi:hypothetical protein